MVIIMKKTSILIVLIIGIIICIMEYTLCISKDYNMDTKTDINLIGNYSYEDIKYDSFKNKSLKQQYQIFLKENNECSINLYRYLYDINFATDYESDYCKYEYDPLNNELILEFDNKSDYYARKKLSLDIKDGGIIYDKEVLTRK